MRTLTIAKATWREAIRQPVAILVLLIAALVTYLSQFVNFYHFDETAGFNIIRQMSVAQTMICGIVIAVFTASAVLAEEIENRTVLTLLAKPVRRWEVILGKFVGIMMAIGAAFVVMVVISLCTVWWAEARIEKWRANPALAVTELPCVATGQGGLQVSRSYTEMVTKPDGRGVDYLVSLGDGLLLVTGQSSRLVARVPLAAEKGRGEMSPGLASMVQDLLEFVPARRTAVLLQAFALAFVHVMVIAAVAVAISTRLPLVFNALCCSAVFVLGNLSRDLGRALREADVGGGMGGLLLELGRWPAVVACYLLPNFENFNLTEALSVGITRVGPGVWIYGVLYGIAYTALVLLIAVRLFRRREVM